MTKTITPRSIESTQSSELDVTTQPKTKTATKTTKDATDSYSERLTCESWPDLDNNDLRLIEFGRRDDKRLRTFSIAKILRAKSDAAAKSRKRLFTAAF